MIDRRIRFWFLIVGCAFSFVWSPAFSQSNDRVPNERDQFIAVLEWSVDRQSEYVWPFASLKPARFRSVRMVVDQMPRAFPENSRRSVAVSAGRTLNVNGRPLPRSPRTGGREGYQIDLVEGRLRFTFSLPAGYKLDQQNAMIRLRLYRVE